MTSSSPKLSKLHGYTSVPNREVYGPRRPHHTNQVVGAIAKDCHIAFLFPPRHQHNFQN